MTWVWLVTHDAIVHVGHDYGDLFIEAAKNRYISKKTPEINEAAWLMAANLMHRMF